MDDSLEQPNSIPKAIPPADPSEEGEDASDEDDGGPDWTKFPSGPLARPVIPKRGEKEFEPNTRGGSALQKHTLERVRSAMFSALNITRSSSSKSISYAVWTPGLSRAHVTTARGIHLATMGHSAPRLIREGGDGKEKVYKRLELLPEEALYLIERGSMFCWKEDASTPLVPGHEDVQGTPMTVQQAYAEMIGKEDLTLEKYQVFAYLKRLGYTVTRARPPDSFYPTPVPRDVSLPSNRASSWFSRVWSGLWMRLRTLFVRRRNWWRPLRLNRWFGRIETYTAIFTSLRFIPTGHDLPLHLKTCLPPTPKTRDKTVPSPPYEIFYNLYKPATPFRKTAPPPPDFSIVVINARETPMPSLHELAALFDVLPEMPPPPPRHAHPARSAAGLPGAKDGPRPPSSQVYHTLSRLIPWMSPGSKDTRGPPAYRPNPFQTLKLGKKTVVIAVVDAGTMSFFRFGQGAFAEWPMA